MHHFDAGQALALIETRAPHDVRRRPDDRDADPRPSRLRQVRHLERAIRLLRRRAGTARTRAAHPGGVSRRPTRQRVRTDRDLGRGLLEQRTRLRRQARQLRTGRAGRARWRSCPRASRASSRRPTYPRGPDVIGELWIKGPNVVRGYWNKPEATAQAFTKGWLHTGDIARIDDEGFVYIVDRAKDMIIRGGENVYSVIVEAAIFEHPDVADCAVVGLAAPHAGRGGRRGHRAASRDASSRPRRSRATSPSTSRASRCPRKIFFRADGAAPQPAGQGPQARTTRFARRADRSVRPRRAARRRRGTSRRRG